MPKKQSTPEDRLERIEAAQQKLLAAATKIESRIDILNGEFQRAATVIYRLNLAQESAKSSLQRREKTMADIRDQLSRIEATLVKR